MSDIYNGKDLLYPLTKSEYEQLDDVWNFINNFKFLTHSLHNYRSKLIDNIKNKYTGEEFLNLELITEKIFWNLRDKTYTFFLTEGQKDINDIVQLKEGKSYNDLLDVMYKDNFYRSFINKLILIDDVDNKYYYKKIEGSFEIFNKNKFNLYTSVVLFNRNLYELIMRNPEKILNINTPKYYYEFDYAFPNLNFGKPFIQTKEYRIKRINKMYYDKDAEKNWFKLLKL